MESYLPVIWAAIIGLAVAMYVILDGFDLGIGILFPFAETDRDRDQMMNSVAPFWDGNETWLVLGGAGMMVAFPLAYSIILPALYLPVIVMLLALVFRGVAFEFRWIGVTSKPHWTFAFAAGSAIAAFCQGVILGGLIQGIKVNNGRGQRRQTRKDPGQAAASSGARLHGDRELVDPARLRADRGALVLAAEFLVSLVGAGRNRAGRIRRVALA
jgi:cytochrome d oxidase subunit CydB